MANKDDKERVGHDTEGDKGGAWGKAGRHASHNEGKGQDSYGGKERQTDGTCRPLEGNDRGTERGNKIRLEGVA